MAAAGRGHPPIDWDSLTFSFTETDRMFVANGSWEDGWSEGGMVDRDLQAQFGWVKYGNNPNFTVRV